MLDATETPAQTPEQERIAQLEEALAAARLELTDAQGTIVRLRRAYTHALEQLQLMRRRLFLAKAERADASAEQLAFDTMFAEFQGIEMGVAPLRRRQAVGFSRLEGINAGRQLLLPSRRAEGAAGTRSPDHERSENQSDRVC